jgi:uncharacterized membrane protein
MSTSRELKKGLKITSHYILSHHQPKNIYRCYNITFFGRNLHLCSRCLGAIPGLLFGIYLGFWQNVQISLAAIALSGVPTLVEKYLTGVKKYDGFNSIRTLTGFLLGLGYIQGLTFLVRNYTNVLVYAVAAFYLAAGTLLLEAENSLISA